MRVKKNVSRKFRSTKAKSRRRSTPRKSAKNCSSLRFITRVRFKPCGCQIILKDQQIFLRLPKPPVDSHSGAQVRLLGYILGNTLHLVRRGTDWLSCRRCYGVNAHLIDPEVMKILGYARCYIDTMARGGFVDLNVVRSRDPFIYAQAGFEKQYPLLLTDIGKGA